MKIVWKTSYLFTWSTSNYYSTILKNDLKCDKLVAWDARNDVLGEQETWLLGGKTESEEKMYGHWSLSLADFHMCNFLYCFVVSFTSSLSLSL